MLTPQELQHVAETMYPLIDNLNAWITSDIIRRLMARYGRGEKPYLTGTDELQIDVYRAAGGYLSTLQQQIQLFTRASDAEIQEIFEAAAIKAWEADEKFYIARGKEKRAFFASERTVEILEDAYQRTKGTIHNFTSTTATASQKYLVRVLDEVHLRVMTGAQSHTAAVADAVKRVSEHQTEVVYPTGHVDTIETAVLRAVRTGVGQASGNITVQGLKEHDWDLIRVSAHLGARYGDGGENPSNHYWWQGGLYSLSGKDKRYPDFYESTGYGTGEGLCGWNCRHSFGPGDEKHNPFKTYNAEENKAAYDLSQKQRLMERKIRRQKQKVLGYSTALSNTEEGSEMRATLMSEYVNSAALLQKYNKAYNDFCSVNGLKKLDDRIAIAKWNRSEAAKATAAARRASKQQSS